MVTHIDVYRVHFILKWIIDSKLDIFVNDSIEL